MTSLVSVAEARAQLSTALTDAQLQAVIDREEAALIRLCGAHYAAGSTVSETHNGGSKCSLYLKRRVASVTSVVEYPSFSTTGTTLAATDYYLWGDEGRLERLPAGSRWMNAPVVVTYTPQDDSLERKAVIIDLLRLTLNRSGLKGESVAGEYSYTAFENTDAERGRVIRRLMFFNV